MTTHRSSLPASQQAGTCWEHRRCLLPNLLVLQTLLSPASCPYWMNEPHFCLWQVTCATQFSIPRALGRPSCSPGPAKSPDHQGHARGRGRSKVKPGNQFANWGLCQEGPWQSTGMAELETSTIPSMAQAGTKEPGLSLHRAPGPMRRAWGEPPGESGEGH